MIKYNSNTINDWNFGDDNIIKVYKHGAVCYYKITSGDTPTPEYKVCFAVVDDISQYADREFEDVYDNATEKWYKLNNLNQYEEYGIYGDGRNITYYKGKLTIDDGYEYEWNGSEWINLGEVTGSSRVPQGYTEVEYIQNTSTAYINTNFKANQDTRIVTEMQTVTSTSYGRFLGAGGYDKINGIQFDYETGANGTLHVSWGTVAGWTIYSSCVGDYNKHTYDWNKNEFYRDNTLIGSVTYGNFQCTDYLAIFGNILNGTAENFLYGKMYTFQLYDNGTLIRDLVPCKRDSDDKYGAYDIVNNVFYTSPNGVDFIGGSETGSTEYPKYYTEKSEPLDNLTFNTLAEAQTYAYNNCVYVGLKATINGDRYIFSGDSQRGYEWVYNPSRLPVGYTEVEYIENSTSAYTETDYYPNQNTRVVAEFQASVLNNNPRMFGAGPWDGLAYIANIENTSPQKYYFKYGETSTWYQTNVQADTNKHKFDLNKNSYYIDDVLAGTASITTFTLTSHLGIFNAPSASLFSNQEAFKGKCYYLKVYDDGTLVRDFVPCIRDNDNTVGLYDIVNDVFYTSNNNYTFIAGPSV